MPAGDKVYKTQCDELWQLTTSAVQCVRVSISYTTSMLKKGSSGTTPSDIDLVYDTQKIGAGWNLYKAGGLSSTASTVTAGQFYKTTAPF